MNTAWKALILVCTSLSCIGCDQATKSLASAYLPRTEMHSYFYDIVRIGYIENTGAFLGMGDNFSSEIRFVLFVVLVAIFLLGLLIYLIKSSKPNVWSLIGLALVFSGGLSNLYDRVVNDGAVVDFLNLGFGSLRTGIFNIADVAIVLGTALYVIFTFWRTDRKTSSSNTGLNSQPPDTGTP